MELNLRDKYFWEECARLILVELGGTELADLRNADRPDLQGRLWGIEVTLAQGTNDGDIIALCNRVMDKNPKDITDRDKEKVEKHGISLGEYQEKIVAFTPPAEFLNPRRILNSFNQKLMKLNADSNYAYFKNYGLFQFSHGLFHEENITDIIATLATVQEKYNRRFSMLFVCCAFNCLWLCDLTKNSYSSIDLTMYWQSKFDTVIIPGAEQYCWKKHVPATEKKLDNHLMYIKK